MPGSGTEYEKILFLSPSDPPWGVPYFYYFVARHRRAGRAGRPGRAGRSVTPLKKKERLNNFLQNPVTDRTGVTGETTQPDLGRAVEF